MTPLLITAGMPLFFLARKQGSPEEQVFNRAERLSFYGLLLLDAVVIMLLITGQVKL